MKKRTFVAITATTQVKGHEYYFITSSAFYVNPARAEEIAEALNLERFDLCNGQEWRIFVDNGEWINSVYKRGIIRGRHIRIYPIADF